MATIYKIIYKPNNSVIWQMYNSLSYLLLKNALNDANLKENETGEPHSVIEVLG